MLHDKGNDFWYGSAALNVAPGNVDSPSIDLKRVSGKPFAGHAVDIHAQVTAAFVGGTAIQLKLQDSADDSTFADVLNATTQSVASVVVPLAELLAGYEWSFPYGPNTVVRRYVRLRAVITGTFTAGGLVTAGLIDKRQTNHLS